MVPVFSVCSRSETTHIGGHGMKLVLRRDQKSGMLSSAIKFTLAVRAEISEEEQAWIKKYKLGETMLYEKMELTDKGSGLLGVAGRLAFKMLNITVSVNDLTKGKSVECKDIVEMIAVEEQIKQAMQTFKTVLLTASQFGGEEVIEI